MPTALTGAMYPTTPIASVNQVPMADPPPAAPVVPSAPSPPVVAQPISPSGPVSTMASVATPAQTMPAAAAPTGSAGGPMPTAYGQGYNMNLLGMGTPYGGGGGGAA
jgi:hypothetical protein